MDENTWRFAQLMMWLIGGQTAFLAAILGILWARINKIDEKITDIDKRVFSMETMMHMKDCCMLKNDSHLKKVE